MHERLLAKLDGFLGSSGQTLAQYKESDTSVAARYARAVAYYRIPNIAKALPLIDGLIAQEPKNAYFHEFKGQMLFENGKVADAVGPYEEAVRLRPAPALSGTEVDRV